MLPPALTARSAAERYVADLLLDCQGVATLFDNKVTKGRSSQPLGLTERKQEHCRRNGRHADAQKKSENIVNALFGGLGLPKFLDTRSLSSPPMKQEHLNSESPHLPTSPQIRTHNSPVSSDPSYATGLGGRLVTMCKEKHRPSSKFTGRRESESAHLRSLLNARNQQSSCSTTEKEDAKLEKEHAIARRPSSAKVPSACVVETPPKCTWRHSRLAGLVLDSASTGDAGASSDSGAKAISRRQSLGLTNIASGKNVVLNQPLLDFDIKVPKVRSAKHLVGLNPYISKETSTNAEQAVATLGRKTPRSKGRKMGAAKALEERLEEEALAYETQEKTHAEIRKTLRDDMLHLYHADLASSQNIRAVKHAMEDDAMQGWELVQLASQLQMSVDDVLLLKSVFDNYDSEQSGTLDNEEFEAAVVKILQLQLHDDTISRERIKSMSDWCWWDGEKHASGRIDFREFSSWFASNGFSEDLLLSEDKRKLRQMAKRYNVAPDYVENVKKNFDICDRDQSGEVEPEEFREIVFRCMKVPPALQCEIPQSRVQSFWSEIDTDGSGKITFSEFFAWWLRYYEKAETSVADMPFETFYKRVRRVGANYLDPPAYPPPEEAEEEEGDAFASLYR